LSKLSKRVDLMAEQIKSIEKSVSTWNRIHTDASSDLNRRVHELEAEIFPPDICESCNQEKPGYVRR
jgi:hypothetical protein